MERAMIPFEDIVLLALFLLLVIFGILLLRRRRPAREESPQGRERAGQEEVKAFLSPAERSLLTLLDKAGGDDLQVFAKVPVSYLLRDIKTTLPGKDKTVYVELADFILCRRDDHSVAGIVLLDPGAKGDSPAEKTLRSAGLAVARISPNKPPTSQELRQIISGMTATDHSDDSFAPAEDWTIGAVSRQSPGEEDDWRLGAPIQDAGGTMESASGEKARQEEVERTCPACGAAMVRHRATRGPLAGKFFWSCTDYPRCPQVLSDSPDK
jgi:hypothetical protein